MKKLLFLCIIIPFLNFAQDNNNLQNHTNLDTIRIHGSIINLCETESGKNTTILTASDINNLSFNSIDELIKLIPNIELQSRGGFGTQSDIVLRGSTFNQTLVLLDGMRVNDPLTGHFSMYIPISPFEISQIEIIRGGGSSIYGPDAVGGIINIVTKTFGQSETHNEIIAETKIGENKFIGTNFFISQNLSSNFNTTLSLNLIKSDGQELYNNIFSFFDNQNFSISHRYNVSNKLSVMLRGSYSKNYFNSQYYYTRSVFDLSNELVEKNWSQLKFNYKLNSDAEVNFHTAHQIVNDLYVFNPDFPHYKNQTTLLNSRLNYIKNTSRYNVVGGVEFQNRKIMSLDRGNHKDYYIGSFINWMSKFNKITFNPSIRLDYNQKYSIQFCPQIDLNYSTQNYILRGSVGRTIRSADFTERFYNNNYSDTLSPGRNLGNPDLRAENSINFEIGLDYNKYKRTNFKTSLFYRKSNDLIDWSLVSGQDISSSVQLIEHETYLYAQNISSLHTLGVESEFWFKILEKIDNVNISGTLGYTKIFSSENLRNLFDSNHTVSSKYLANSSGDRLNYNLFVDWKKMRLNLNGILKIRDGDSELTINQSLDKSYFINNINLSYDLNNKLSLKFEVLNILNTEYADILGAIMPNRWGILGVKYHLK